MSHYFAYLARMKFIQRWGLMRNTRTENIQEHSLQVAMIAHALALFENERLGARVVDPDRTALLAVYHDAEEVITGDLPTPVKYFNPKVREAVDGLEEVAKRKLLGLLPEALRPQYEPLYFPRPEDAPAWRMSGSLAHPNQRPRQGPRKSGAGVAASSPRHHASGEKSMPGPGQTVRQWPQS
ncbi:MAG: 5'-deoxynucleotidase, partial [Trueperaceae bacterium]|nr:5'-deoxynucleotidase [Trueperaceae bacterium]